MTLDADIAPPRLPNGAPVVFGEGSIYELPRLVREAGARGSALLVRGRRSFKRSGASAVLPRLEHEREVIQWNEFQTNPSSSDLERGLALFRQLDPGLVIGIGGGSVMDMAKLLCAYGALPTDADLSARIRTADAVEERKCGLILAPTTSGSGSEATHFAVVYIGEEKHSIGGPALRPDGVLLDPALSSTGTSYQRASSGIDAICQAIESMWAVGATDESRRFATQALESLLPSIESFVGDVSSEDARSMCLGSHLAGRAIDISKTTAAHALSYAITQRYGISHGHAVALTMGPLLALHDRARAEDLQGEVDPNEHRDSMSTVFRFLRARDAEDARNAFASLLRRLGLETDLASLGVGSRDELRALAYAVNPVRLANNPVRLEPERLYELLSGITDV